MIRIILLFVISVFSSYFVSGQEVISTSKIKPNPKFHFKAHPNQKFGFDNFEHIQWKEEYQTFRSNGIAPVYASYKSVNFLDRDRVLLVYKGIRKLSKSHFSIEINNQKVLFSQFDDSTITIDLPRKKSDYVLKARWKDQIVAMLFTQVHKEIREKIVIVPLSPVSFNGADIREKINSIYSQANLQFDLRLDDVFESKIFESKTILSSPPVDGHNQYTGQMRLLRDLYFENNPKMDKNAYFIFVVNGFSDSLFTGFMVKNKSIAFVKNASDLDSFSIKIAQTIGFGVGALDYSWLKKGPEKGHTNNLMDTTFGTHLTFFQWNSLHQLPNYYSYYDNEENIKTNNGTISYYFWKEDKKGNIIFHGNNFLEAIKRPYKHNFLSYRFKVKYLLLRPFYKVGSYFVSILDFIFLFLILFLLWYIRRRLKKYWKDKKFTFTLGRRIIFALFVFFVAFAVYDNYWVTNRILYYFKQISGPLKELDRLNYTDAKDELLKNEKLLHQEVQTVCSEILIKRDKSWFIKKRSKVLYFEVKLDTENRIDKMKFIASNDSIHLSSLDFHKKALGHYMVFNFINSKDSLERQEVYNHYGTDISSKLSHEDIPKRILVFVNGYRPTSIGRTFEENFSDIQNNGLEYSNSKNFIYDFDRFDYWRPWREINLLFQKRLNPNETYYADGHFSVATSNYRSLINFSSISSLYPKRCINKKNHQCYEIQDESFKQFILNQSKTINQLKMSPNKKGFKLRKDKGRIAGRNLLQIVNEIPDFSKNDTVYIVAHSMGFAYSQGIIEELRGKINFGGYYVIAPENAKGGKINTNEWKEVWQYGSNFNRKNQDAPCLQDGIAPQYLIPGLPYRNRVFIPNDLYKCKGFFDSHFIGYYTWVFDINKDLPGYIEKK